MMQPDHRPNQYGPQAYNSKRLPRLTREQVPLNRAPVLGQILNFGHTQDIIPHWILETEHPEKLKDKGKDTEEKKGQTLEIDFRWNHRSIRYDTVGSLTAIK